MYVTQQFGISGVIDNRSVHYIFYVKFPLTPELSDAFYDEPDEVPQWAIDQSWEAFVSKNASLFKDFDNLLNPLTFQAIPECLETMKNWEMFVLVTELSPTKFKLYDKDFLTLLGGFRLAMFAKTQKEISTTDSSSWTHLLKF